MRSSGLLSSNAKLGIVGVHVLSVGRLNHAFVEPREVFQAALMNNADSITAFHNHPSGDPKPSVEDIFMTRKIKAAGKMPGLS